MSPARALPLSLTGWAWRLAAVITAAGLLLAGCGDAGVPAAPENPIEGDPLPNQGRAEIEEPDPGSTLGGDVPNPQPEQCEHTLEVEAGGALNLLEAAEEAGHFAVFLDLLADTDLADELENAGPFTVFAPTDEAFAALPPGVLDIYRTNPDDREQLLRYHVISGACTSDDLETVTSVSSLTDRDIAIGQEDDDLLVEQAPVVHPDIEAGNGVLHGLDTVLLLPPVPGE